MERRQRLRIAGTLLGGALLCGCATPSHRADAIARNQHFQKQIESGSGFDHVVYRNAAPLHRGMLHVYIEGDGTPYWQPDIAATDPTPRDPLMLKLMSLDSDRSIYLGRPCYFGLYGDRACKAIFWTLRRYGPEVLDSMEAALRTETARAGATQVELFGHSGGGSLAILLAQRVDSVTRVVTIGANLDIAVWCRLHHYAPLIGSVNPVDEPSRRADLKILHLVGENDTNAPPSLLQNAALARGGEPVRVIERLGHNCCWESAWTDLLREGP